MLSGCDDVASLDAVGGVVAVSWAVSVPPCGVRVWSRDKVCVSAAVIVSTSEGVGFGEWLRDKASVGVEGRLCERVGLCVWVWLSVAVVRIVCVSVVGTELVSVTSLVFVPLPADSDAVCVWGWEWVVVATPDVVGGSVGEVVGLRLAVLDASIEAE